MAQAVVIITIMITADARMAHRLRAGSVQG